MTETQPARARRPRGPRVDAAQRAKIKAEAVACRADGLSVAEVAERIGFAPRTLEVWRRQDRQFAEDWQAAAMQARRRGKGDPSVVDDSRKPKLSFAEFRLRFLNMRTFPHQQNMIDVVEGRPPSWRPDGIEYESVSAKHILINLPPEHAKSMTMSVDYPTYLIANDPNVRILIVSKTREKAKEFVYAIKQRLTHPRYRSLQLAYGPADGWEKTADKWAADSMYLGGESRDSAEKDPTLQALGIGGQIYGARADIIILDDCVVLTNAGEFEKQIRWIQQEVLTRLGPGGRLVILGTRVDVRDLYSEIVDDERYPNGKSPWTLLRMPAVLQFAKDPKDWVTLWPRSDHQWPGTDDPMGEDGLYPRWDGPYLNARRGLLDAKTWAMVYMQAKVSDAAVFPSELVRACIHQFRQPGMLRQGVSGHPESTANMEVVCGLDPAMTGDTAAIAMAIDRRTRHRWVLDAARITSPTPQAIRDLIFGWTETYKPSTWVVEKNAFQLFLTQDEGIRAFLASRGVVLREHYTSGTGKWDSDYGVASMAPLFGQFDANKQPMRDGMIHLPSTQRSEACKALVEQLITWAPATKNKTDLVMALWFAEIRAREIVLASDRYSGTHLANRWLTPRQRSMRATVNVDEWIWQQAQLESQGVVVEGRFVAS